jgi:hypothetical protein
MNTNYLSRLHREKKILFLVALDKSNPAHVMQLKDIFNNIAVKNRNYVFSYLDSKDDASLLRFFTKNTGAKIILYNFVIGKHYLLDKLEEDVEFSSELDDLIKHLNNDEILWTSGYPLEDFLTRLGIKISRTNLMILTLGLFTFLIIVLITFMCRFVGEKEKEE